MNSSRCLAVGGAPSRLEVVADAERFEVFETVVGRVAVDVVNLELRLAIG
jgi:hypothetical protein